MKRTILTFIAVVCLVGCDAQVADSSLAQVADSSLDDRLHEALRKAGGVREFLLPESDTFDRIPQDPKNPLSTEKVELGRLLFHETALAVKPVREVGRGTYSCATCHLSETGFQSGLQQSIGEGGRGYASRVLDDNYTPADADIQPIRTLSPLNGAWQPLTFWNGQFGSGGANAGTEGRWSANSVLALNHLGYEGMETQAIAALRTHRMTGGASAVVSAFPAYRALFEAAFPGRDASDETAGLAIAAYERTLVANQSPFQLWLRGESGAMTDAEKRGALVFLGRGQCTSCHAGPALASTTFHALGMGDLQGPFEPYDLADPVHIGRAGFTGRTEDQFRYRTPQLYNLVDNAGLGHGATFTSVRELVEYKNAAVPENPFVAEEQLSPKFQPLDLTADDIDALTAFLERALRDPNLTRYRPDSLPSGQCLPSNDDAAQIELGCEPAP